MIWPGMKKFSPASYPPPPPLFPALRGELVKFITEKANEQVLHTVRILNIIFLKIQLLLTDAKLSIIEFSMMIIFASHTKFTSFLRVRGDWTNKLL